MKNYFSRTFKKGNLSITVFSDEVVIVLVTRKKVYIKHIRRFLPGFSLKISAAVVCSAIFVLAASLFFFTGNDTAVYEDDREKIELMMSSKTDYSSPETAEKLTIHKHRVKRGETLSEIAGDYGVSMDTICGSNNLRSYDLIREGTLLRIPNRDGLLYKMRAGNSVVGIARKYRVSLKKIISENNIKNPDFIPVGQVLFVPDAKPQNIIPGFMWPTRSRFITCGYGWRRSPFNRRKKEFHHGLDIRSRYEWIRATKYGKITYTGWLGGYGKTVIIAHPAGYKTLYAHMSRIIVRRGQYVKQGQTIGRSGNTGRSTGAHLHFEVMKNGRHKNPYFYLRRGR